ncbi:TRAP transporter large permease [Halorhodospira halophila]|uniref:TRAP transporter large permease protein n=1 Tax=Halorhodospira halophila (strain DSM 244 / SL1) TaxID=349124 RepID=A1WU76_HALHL|nr:TRAP transporter large permease [Halorhodospira halophila]ABM61238.1 TRAP dicarboxylate transporter, DctM subunit [Halorhodospira halophila SL1]MBK1730030.1 TRAP transporter large permease [Halorhodospira halophila]
MTTLVITVMLILLLLGFPLMVPLLAGALLILIVELPFIGADALVRQMITGIQPVVLSAVPLFILAADIMTRGRTANTLLDLVATAIGHIRGGLPITTAVSCALFGAVSGSTQATVVAMGTPLRPRLQQAGYKDSFNLALIVNASDVALLIPPSIGMIIYGVVAQTSPAQLFIAGIGPGLLILLLISLWCYIYTRWQGIEGSERAGWGARGQALLRALPALGFPVIIVGGIYSGFFTPTEAAAISVLYAAILEFGAYRSLGWRDLLEVARSTGLITAVVFILVGAGQAFAYSLSFAQIPQELVGPLIDAVAHDPTLALLAIALIYFIGCMFVDPIVVILVFTPILAPLVEAAQLDPVLVGTLVVLQAAIGSATPPFGVDLFTAIAVFRRPYLEVIRGTPPFIAIMILATLLVIFFPEIALFLRDLAFG